MPKLYQTIGGFEIGSKRYAVILGIDLSRECSVETTLGVGGAETVYQHKNLPVKIGNWEKKIPVGFLERDDVPPLLGRLKCLETIHIHFKNKKSVFEI